MEKSLAFTLEFCLTLRQDDTQSKEQIEEIRDTLYQIAELLIDNFLKEKSLKNKG